MSNVRRLVVFALIFVHSVSSKVLDDAKCDDQLRSFDAAFQSRELWALRCEFKVIKDTVQRTIQLSVQCMTCGQKCLLVFFMGISRILVTTLSVFGSETKTFKANIAC